MGRVVGNARWRAVYLCFDRDGRGLCVRALVYVCTPLLYALTLLLVLSFSARACVCCSYEAEHKAVALTAWWTLILYSVAAPIVMYLLVARKVRLTLLRDGIDYGILARQQAERQALYVEYGGRRSARLFRRGLVCACGAGRDYVAHAGPGALAAASAMATDPFAPGSHVKSLSEEMDSNTHLQRSRPLRLFVASGYRPSRFAFRLLDMGLLFVLSLLLVAFSSVTTISQAAAKFSLTAATIVLVWSAYVAFPPFVNLANNRWKHLAKLANLTLLLAMAALNFINSLLVLRSAVHTPPDTSLPSVDSSVVAPAVTNATANDSSGVYDPTALYLSAQTLTLAVNGLAYTCLVLSLALFLAITVGFGTSVFKETRREAKFDAAERKALRQRAVRIDHVVSEAVKFGNRGLLRPRTHAPAAASSMHARSSSGSSVAIASSPTGGFAGRGDGDAFNFTAATTAAAGDFSDDGPALRLPTSDAEDSAAGPLPLRARVVSRLQIQQSGSNRSLPIFGGSTKGDSATMGGGPHHVRSTAHLPSRFAASRARTTAQDIVRQVQRGPPGPPLPSLAEGSSSQQQQLAGGMVLQDALSRTLIAPGLPKPQQQPQQQAHGHPQQARGYRPAASRPIHVAHHHDNNDDAHWPTPPLPAVIERVGEPGVAAESDESL